jgi:hypothetical protein
VTLEEKLFRLHRDGGTLTWRRSDGTVKVYDLLPGKAA